VAPGYARSVTLPEVAVRACRFLAGEEGEAVAHKLLEVERKEGLPTALLVAAAYEESNCGTATRCGDGGRSCGVVQFGGWAIPGIRDVALELAIETPVDPRYDVVASATYWARHVKRGRAYAKRGSPPNVRPRRKLACKGRAGYASVADRLWSSANLTAVRAPRCVLEQCVERDSVGCSRYRCRRYGPRCAVKGRYETNHWRRLRRWRKIAKYGEQATEGQVRDQAVARARGD
jgi:hypothetical protein